MKIRMIAIMLAGVLTFSGITSTAFASEACVREPLIVEMAEEVMTASEEAACTGGYTEQPFLSFDKIDFILAKGKSTVVKASFAAGDSIVRVVPTRPDVVKAVWSGRMITVSGKAKGMTTVAVKTKRGKVVKFRVTVPKTATKAVKASDLTLNKGRAGKDKSAADSGQHRRDKPDLQVLKHEGVQGECGRDREDGRERKDDGCDPVGECREKGVRGGEMSFAASSFAACLKSANRIPLKRGRIKSLK